MWITTSTDSGILATGVTKPVLRTRRPATFIRRATALTGPGLVLLLIQLARMALRQVESPRFRLRARFAAQADVQLTQLLLIDR